jgi:DNA-binding transcriptional LysR family regulator
MLDALSLDQLRTFIAAAEAGSFSAAGRRIGRAQSVVSQTIANLEGLLSVRLFERDGRYPRLTADGQALLPRAREVVAGLDRLKAQAKGLATGLEPALAVVVNVMFPSDILAAAVSAFHLRFPDTPLRIGVEGMGAVIEPVLARDFDFGIRGPLATAHPELQSEFIMNVDYVMLAAADHPLARRRGPIPTRELLGHVQLVLSDRSRLTEGRDFRVMSDKTWRISDLGAKHAFLKQGVGWGGMPVHVVRDDIEQGRLVPLELEERQLSPTLAMSAVHRIDRPPGPAGRWLIDELKRQSERKCPLEARTIPTRA